MLLTIFASAISQYQKYHNTLCLSLQNLVYRWADTTGHVVGTCCSDKNLCSAHWGDMWHDRVAGTKSHHLHTLWNCCGYMFQGYVAATCPLVWTDTFLIVQHQFGVDFVPATSNMKFNKLNFMGHVASTDPWNMYPQHFHVCANVVISSLLHFPSIRPECVSPQCVLHTFLSLEHVAGTWSLVSAHLKNCFQFQKIKTMVMQFFFFRDKQKSVMAFLILAN